MSKYEPLRRYLARQRAARVEMTFNEIENMIGALLPKAAARAVWWDEAAASGAAVQTRAWRGAGYRAQLGANERVVFERNATLTS
jgi:hypothetical protein